MTDSHRPPVQEVRPAPPRRLVHLSHHHRFADDHRAFLAAGEGL
ncbi:hypothetical protein [Kitasatospora sp. CB01950]|nr:hypothetical protein [Kitasatospora sp. CB01950]